nr:hypothetical protein FFPRI1PSEUD_34520 [Pseudomonas sp. FFPRI_1]
MHGRECRTSRPWPGIRNDAEVFKVQPELDWGIAREVALTAAEWARDADPE